MSVGVASCWLAELAIAHVHSQSLLSAGVLCVLILIFLCSSVLATINLVFVCLFFFLFVVFFFFFFFFFYSFFFFFFKQKTAYEILA